MIAPRSRKHSTRSKHTAAIATEATQAVLAFERPDAPETNHARLEALLKAVSTRLQSHDRVKLVSLHGSLANEAGYPIKGPKAAAEIRWRKVRAA